MRTFGQDVPTAPIVPDEKTRILRVKLLLEEVLELAEASGVQVFANNDILQKDAYQMTVVGGADIVAVADALTDIDYVNLGAASAYGINLEPCQTEVHHSNMTKLWSSVDLEQIGEHQKRDGVIYTIQSVGRGQFLVKRPDGKVVKSPSYRPANLKAVLYEQLAKKV